MLNTRKVLFLENSIMEVSKCGDYLVALDNTYKLHIIHPSKLDLIKSVTLTKHPHYTHKYSNAFSASNAGLFIIPFVKTKKGVVYSFVKEISRKSVISWHEQDIECASFSKDGKILATGGQDGKVFLFDTTRYEVLTTLPARGDYISSISFSDDSKMLVSSCFDKFTTIFDIERNRVLHNLKSADVVEKCSFFDDDRKIFMILRNGSSLIYDTIERKTQALENHFRNWPSSLDLSFDRKYAVVGTRSNALYAIRAEDNAKLLDITLEYSGIGVVRFYKDMLILGTIEGALLFVDYSVGSDELECALNVKDFSKAREVVEKNLFLSIHPMMEIFDKEWPKILKEAVNMLNGDSVDDAISLVEPFVVDVKKKKEFEFYLMQKDVVALFADAVEKKEFDRAYELIGQNRFLVKTLAFSKLEAHWNKLFHRAKQLLEENPVMNQRVAAATLAPFERTEKKEIIAQLLKNGEVFSQAEALIKKRAFKGYFDICQKFQFLKETELYSKVMSLGEKMMEDFNRLEREQEYQKAFETAKVLSNFPPYKKSVNDKVMIAKSKKELIEAIEKGNIKRAYELVETYEVLKTMPQFKILTEDFMKTFERCKEGAYEGRPGKVMSCMSDFMEIKYWSDKIASLMKIAYIHEIENNIAEEDINWELTLRRYVQRFSKDDEIKKLLTNAKLDKFLDAIEEEGDRLGYKHRAFLDEIIVYKSEQKGKP